MEIRLPITYKVRTIRTDELMDTYAFDEVLGYCSRCNNYGVNHSCPDFSFDTKQTLKDYPSVTLILTEISSAPLVKMIDDLTMDMFSSRVSDNQTKNDKNLVSEIAMYMFNEMKDMMAEELLAMEKMHAGYSSPAGSCTKCQPCTKLNGKACVDEDHLRYSLEALGFLVHKIYDRFFEEKLGWTEGQFPDSYHTCSALFTLKPCEDDFVEGYLANVIPELIIKIYGSEEGGRQGKSGHK